MSKKNNLIHEYKTNLKAQCKYGESKAEAKRAAKDYAREHNVPYEQPRGIYSTTTYNNYDKACKYFLEYCLDNHKEDIRHWDDCKKYAGEYISGLIHSHSAWTVHLYATAIASSYDTKVKDLIPDVKLPERERKDIIRGRDLASQRLEQDVRFQKSIMLLKATGARRKEMLRLRKEDFREQVKDGQKTGNLEVYKRGKGGLERWCLVNPNYTQEVKDFLEHATTHKAAGEDRLIRKSDMPETEVHSYRADYARDLYDYFESQGYASGKMYHCRKEMAGVVYDKGLLEEVSYHLQHHRNNVVISYLWK